MRLGVRAASAQPLGPWGLTSAVPAPAGAAEAASGTLLSPLAAVLAEVWGSDVGPLGLAHACPGCGATDHGAPSLTGLPEGLVALVSFSHVGLPTAGTSASGPRVRHRVGAWWAPEEGPAPHTRTGLGLDLARVDDPAFAEPDGLGAVAFSRAERAWIAARRPADRPAARARLWARKEALVKAAGTGFTGDPADVDALRVLPGVRVVDLGGSSRPGGPGSRIRPAPVQGPPLPPGVVGALALLGALAAPGR